MIALGRADALTLAHEVCLARRVLPPGAPFPATAEDARKLAQHAGRISLTIQASLETYADSLDLWDKAMAFPPGEARMSLLLRSKKLRGDAANGFLAEMPRGDGAPKN